MIFFFWASSSFIHFLGALDLGAGLEQPFDCLIVQNRQAVQSMGRSMDWTLEDNMVDGLFFCAIFTGRRGGHTPFVQAGAETSDTGGRRLSRTWALLGRVIQGVCVPVSGIKIRSLVGLFAHSTFHWWYAHSAARICCCCQMNWWVAVRRVQMGVSIWGALHLHSMDG